MNFFDLNKKERLDVINSSAISLGISPAVLEKDIWLCLVLQKLFSLPDKIAFKGGTSLSKVYNLIDRFSEDVDITLDYANFIASPVPFSALSKTAIRKLSDQLKQNVSEYVHGTVFTKLKDYFGSEFPAENISLSVNENGEELRVHYPSLFSDNGYLQSNILVEFGGRNTSEPSEQHKITTLLSGAIPHIEFPVAHVNVLSPVRTFWEKATLIHVECHRDRLNNSPERLSRHWYDLSRLSNTWISEQALSDKSLLRQVVELKMAFFNSSCANYENCLVGKFRLIPDNEGLRGLEVDYLNMHTMGMFHQEPPTFNEIIATVSQLENEINSSF